MCNQSVPLVQRLIEDKGVSTNSITMFKELSQKVKPPRSVYIRFPLGNPFGEPFQAEQQKIIIDFVLHAAEKITVPGTILDLPYRWKRMGRTEGIQKALD